MRKSIELQVHRSLWLVWVPSLARQSRLTDAAQGEGRIADCPYDGLASRSRRQDRRSTLMRR
jgi:hypothetical protein